MKTFYVTHNVGKVKYLLSYHDGITAHKDGSPFFGVRCFNNKKKLHSYIKILKSEGYSEK